MLYEPTPEHNRLEKYSANEIVDLLETILTEYRSLLYSKDSSGQALINQMDGINDFNGQPSLSSELNKLSKFIEKIKDYVSNNNLGSISIKEFYTVVANTLGKKSALDYIRGIDPEKAAILEILKRVVGRDSIKDALAQKNPHYVLIFKKLLEYAKS